MKKYQIKTSNQEGMTVVWYLNKDNCAVCVDIEKSTWDGQYECKRGRDRVTGFRLKKNAIAHAKKMLKWAMQKDENFAKGAM
jgi:hypothetical protein